MGQWIKDEKGWWYKNGTGSYPQDQWAYLNYNGTYNWYRFNKEGYLVTGWFTDAGDNTYYLHPVSDGTMGYMYTGWHQIDGKWYCFNTETDAGQGALLKGTVTPDGYSVDEAGIWIQ
jgi:glucan-binding YG repeat protein